MDIESKTYIGTKIVTASPMTRGEYNKYRGWDLPADENGEDAGYFVEYEPDGHPNVDGHDGYVSWSPAPVFDGAYKPANNFYERLLIEADELHDKLAKLRTFLDSNEYTLLPAGDRDLLQDQYNFMHDYSKILNARIDRHNATPQTEAVDGGPEPYEPPAGTDTISAQAEYVDPAGSVPNGTDTGLAAPTTDTTQS